MKLEVHQRLIVIYTLFKVTIVLRVVKIVAAQISIKPIQPLEMMIICGLWAFCVIKRAKKEDIFYLLYIVFLPSK